jgi:long-chain fatty acid transport protein
MKKILFIVLGLSISCLSAISVLPSSVQAAGYAILEQSTEGVGNAFAGAVTGYGDGSSVYFNPAAMTSVDETVATVGGHIIIPYAKFGDQGSTVSGAPNTGFDQNEGGQTGFVPNVYLVHPLNEDLSIGLVYNAPFGLATEYDDGWVGRYQGLKSDLAVQNFGGAVGLEVIDGLSLGAGLSGYYADAELTNAVDFGTIAVGSMGPATAGALGLMPQANDGFLGVSGNDWGLAWNTGAVYSYGEDRRNKIGISYKSKVDLSLDGTADFEVPTEAMVLTSSGTFTDSGATADVTLPESITFGLTHWIDKYWAFLYESQWTRWSRFDKLEIVYDNPAQPTSTVEENWENSWRHAVGITHLPAQNLEVRAGIAYDQTPIPNRHHRTPRIPGHDRYWIASGVGYHVNNAVRLDLSYAYLFVPDAKSASVGPTGDVFQGNWSSNVHIVSASVLYQF